MFFWEIPPVSDTKTAALPALQGHSRDDFLFTKSPALQQHPSAVTEKMVLKITGLKKQFLRSPTANFHRKFFIYKMIYPLNMVIFARLNYQRVSGSYA